MQSGIIEKHIHRVNNWLGSLPARVEKFAIVYHGDCDGVISAVLFDYVIRETLAKSDIVHIPVRTEDYDFKRALEIIDANIPDVVIFLDLSIQNHPDKLQQVSGDDGRPILIYDHHSQYNDQVPEKTLYLNPSVTRDGFDENSPPPCLFSARLAQKRIGWDFDWAACIGLIGESAVDRYLSIFQKLPQQFPHMFSNHGIEDEHDVYESKLKDISYAVASAFWAPPGEYEQVAFEVLAAMVRRNAPQRFFDSDNRGAIGLMKLEKEVRSEINQLAVEAAAYCYHDPEVSLRYAEIESEYRVGGVVATRLVRKFPKDIIVTGQLYSDRYVVEARSGTEQSVNVAELLQKAAAELNPYSVGGHPAAAGATLPPDSSSEFFIALEHAVKQS